MSVMDEDVQAADEAGVPIEDMSPEEVAEPTPPMQIPLEGTIRQLSIIVGGDRPQTAEVKLRGGSQPLEGEFKKGDVIELFVRARVSELHFVDLVDKYGEVTGTVRRHIVKPISVRRLSSVEE